MGCDPSGNLTAKAGATAGAETKQGDVKKEGEGQKQEVKTEEAGKEQNAAGPPAKEGAPVNQEGVKPTEQIPKTEESVAPVAPAGEVKVTAELSNEDKKLLDFDEKGLKTYPIQIKRITDNGAPIVTPFSIEIGELGKIIGKGSDPKGDFTIKGLIKLTGDVILTKKYTDGSAKPLFAKLVDTVIKAKYLK